MQSAIKNFQPDFERPLMFVLGKRVNRANASQRNTNGFTLIELLLAIAIVAVLATMTLSVMRSSVEDAKAAATRSTIQRIGAMLQLQMEQYEVRRLPFSRAKLDSAVATLYPALSTPQKMVARQYVRQRIIADIVNAEMPRLFPNSSPAFKSGYEPISNCNGIRKLALGDYPVSVSDSMSLEPPLIDAFSAAEWLSIKPANVSRWDRLAKQTSPINYVVEFDLPGEYLYEILKGIDLDGVSGLEGIGNSSIGDSDDDGILEVVDAWGAPFVFDIKQIKVNPEMSSGKIRYVDDPSGTLVPLNTAFPRSLDKLRFEISSPNLN